MTADNPVTRALDAASNRLRGVVPALGAPELHGLAASPGTVTAPARVVRSAQDFEQLRDGEVLVVAMTTDEHTALFGRAAALVTDVGGALGHGAVTALGHQLPAVLGTGIATRRIHTGMVITVDGDHGRVTLPATAEPLPIGFRPRVPYKFAIAGALAVAALVARRIS